MNNVLLESIKIVPSYQVAFNQLIRELELMNINLLEEDLIENEGLFNTQYNAGHNQARICFADFDSTLRFLLAVAPEMCREFSHFYVHFRAGLIENSLQCWQSLPGVGNGDWHCYTPAPQYFFPDEEIDADIDDVPFNEQVGPDTGITIPQADIPIILGRLHSFFNEQTDYQRSADECMKQLIDQGKDEYPECFSDS